MLAFPSREADAALRLRDPRQERQANEIKRMEFAIRDLAYSRPSMVVLGPDPVVHHLMAAAGFESHQFLAKEISMRGKRVTAIVVPSRLWNDPEARAALFAVKGEARADRTRCVLVPQRSICGSARGKFAAILAKGRGVRCDEESVDAVVSHVREARITTVAECASVVPRHPDPLGLILAMTARGFISMQRSVVVDGRTLVSANL